MLAVLEGDSEVIIIQFALCWVVVQFFTPLLEGNKVGPTTAFRGADRSSADVGVGIFFAAVDVVLLGRSFCSDCSDSVVEKSAEGVTSVVLIELNVALEVRRAGSWGNFLAINDVLAVDGVDSVKVILGVIVEGETPVPGL